MPRLRPSTTALIVVDIQERLAPAMPEETFARLLRAVTILLNGARLLGAPVLVTEQYTKGLGPTVEPVRTLLEGVPARRFEKMEFSAAGTPGFLDAFRATGASDVVVVGVETHVCVYQTVRDLAEAGYRVHVPIDGVSSRREDHRETGLEMCERAGAARTTAESVVFEWMERAGGDVFKEMSRVVR